ncbi:unnamed protein product [Symbiodinium microadriaticum]|nr:unnamed protein product [Symbiodinium microadriaticum]
MFDQVVHGKRSEQEIGVQANWKNPGPLVLKHARSRSSLPAFMIKDLVSEVSKEYEPESAREDDAIDDAEDRGDCLTEFFTKDKVPELALRQIFGRQKLPEDLCLLLADKGMLSVPRSRGLAMLGDTITSVKATIKAIGGDDTKFGPDEPARELSLTLLAAIWKLASTLQEHVATRRAKMEEDPSKIPEKITQKFVERIHCDYMVHGTVAFYEAGPLKYLSELEEWRHENEGLSLFFSADSLPRKVYNFSNDKRKDFPTFSSALKEVLKNHKQLENDARSTAELDKFKQVAHDPTSTKRPRSTSPPPPPPPASDKDKDKSKPSGGAKLTARADRDPCIPEKGVESSQPTYVDEVVYGRCALVRCLLVTWSGEQDKVLHPDGRWIFATKPAQIYPVGLALAWSAVVEQVLQGTLPQFTKSFDLVIEPADRKRKLGDSVPWQGHRQEQLARLAAASGYQLKRGITHPLTVQPEIPTEIFKNIDAIAPKPLALEERCLQDPQYWNDRAQALLPATEQEFRAIADPALRRLLRGGPDYADLQLGSFTHVKLYDELLEASKGADRSLAQGLRAGFPIAESRAWEFRKKIFRRYSAVPVSDNLRSLWKSTMEDVAEGSTVGPFQNEDDMTQFLGCDDWIPTQRFEVVQKNKIRGCDSANPDLINKTAVINEKLQLPTTDLNVAVLRELRTRAGDRRLQGWLLHERKAYRQLPILPQHRKFNVICLKDPENDRPKYFVMIAVLGVTFNLEDCLLEIKEKRKPELVESIDAILDLGTLDPGTVGKLKGKLMFGASQLWGKVGRIFFRPHSERRYSKDFSGDRMELNEVLKRSLIYWRGLIEFGPPRDFAKAERGPDRVGAVMFDRRGLSPKQFTEVIPPSISEKWLPRKTQIVPIEMIAPILALVEAVEASLVKGYSSKEDLCELVEFFWELSLEYRANFFIDRASTDANPADWPSKD